MRTMSVVVLGLFVVPVLSRADGGYEFRLVARDEQLVALRSDPSHLIAIYPMAGTVSINQAGEVAFGANYYGESPAGGGAVIASSLGQLVAIFAEDGDLRSFIQPRGTAIDDSGSVAFRINKSVATLDFNRIYLDRAGAVSTISPYVPPGVEHPFSDPAMNGPGSVVFGVQWFIAGEGGDVAIYGSDGAAAQPLYAPADTSWSLGPPSINNAGQSAFLIQPEGPEDRVVRREPGGSLTTIAERTGIFTSCGGSSHCIGDSVAIAETGRVAFLARFDEGGGTDLGLFTGSGGPTTRVADTSGRFSDLANPLLTSAGAVLFQAELDAGGHGIFEGLEPGAKAIVRDGDAVLGESVSALELEAINDVGQFAFSALLPSRQRAVFRADPVPEPDLGSNAGAIITLLSLMRAKRTRSLATRG